MSQQGNDNGSHSEVTCCKPSDKEEEQESTQDEDINSPMDSDVEVNETWLKDNQSLGTYLNPIVLASDDDDYEDSCGRASCKSREERTRNNKTGPPNRTLSCKRKILNWLNNQDFAASQPSTCRAVVADQANESVANYQLVEYAPGKFKRAMG